MAESQYAFEYTAQAEAGIRQSLTEPRLGRYLKRGGFQFASAMRWYLWNARLAKAFQFPLQVMEVTLRNAVVKHLSLNGAPADWAFDATWIANAEAADAGIREILNKSKRQLLRKRMPADEYKAGVTDADPLDVPSFGYLNTHDVTANMSLEFWVRMLGPAHERAWQVTLRRVFPNATLESSRGKLRKTAFRIKDFRSRVAHHEPIFHRQDLEDVHRSILDVVGMRCAMTRSWVSHFSTFRAVLSQGPDTRPAPGEEAALPSARPLTVIGDPEARVADVLPGLVAGSGWAVVTMGGNPVLIGPRDVVAWLASWSGDGLADLEETVGALLAKAAAPHRVETAEPTITVAQVGARFFPRNVPTRKKPTAIVLNSDGTAGGEALGVLLRDEVRPTRT